MDYATFIDDANWREYIEHGVCFTDYSLRIEFNRGVLMADAVEILWSHPSLLGPWEDKASFLGPPEPFCAMDMYGLITIKGYSPLGCRSSVIPDINDFLYLDIPFRMIQQVATIQMPFNPEQDPWIPTFEHALALIGDTVFAQCPYDVATIGGWGGWVSKHRADGTQLTETEAVAQGGFLISPERWEELALDVPVVKLPSGLRWIPRRIYGDPT